MVKSFTQYLKKNFLSIITLLIVIVILYGYFKVYIPGRQDQLNASQFRALTRLNGNINNKIDAFSSYNRLTKEFIQRKQLTKKSTLEIGKIIFSLNKENHAISLKLNAYNKADSSNKFGTNKDGLEDTILTNINPVNEPHKTFEVLSIWKWDDFIGNLLRNDFDSYLIISNNKLVYNSNPSLGISVSTITERRDSILKDVLKLNISNINTYDSVFSNNYPALMSSMIRNINIGGEAYKLFILPIKNSSGFKKNSGQEHFLCGLVSVGKYNAEVRIVPDNILYFITITLILFLLSLPFVKLLLINELERVVTRDLIVAIVCIMTAATLLTVSFLFWRNEYNRSDSTTLKCNSIADVVKKEFVNEIDLACRHLVIADSISNSRRALDSLSWLINPGDSIVTFYGKKFNVRKDTSFTNFDWEKVFPHNYNSFFWLNDSGMQQNIWVRNPNNLNGGDYSERRYFTDIENNVKNYYPVLVNNDTNNFCIEPVISWTTGTLHTVISKKSVSPNHDVACISINNFFGNQFIPFGYGYNIIDKHGNVLYSSDSTKDLNENLFEECGDSTAFTAAVYSRTREQFITNYSGMSSTFIIQPLGNTPYYIAVYSLNGFSNQRVEHVMYFTYTCTIALFLFVVILLLLIGFIKSRSSHLKISDFQLDWLWPVKFKKTDYKIVLFFNVIVILLTNIYILTLRHFGLVTANYSAFLMYIFMVEVLFVTAHIFVQFDRFSNDYDVKSEHKRVIRTFGVLTVLLVLVAQSVYGLGAVVLFYALILTGVYYIIKVKGKKWVLKSRLQRVWKFKRLNKIINFDFSEVNLCALIFLSWLFITCTIPATYFTKYSYEQINLRQQKRYQAYFIATYPVNDSLTGSRRVFDDEICPTNITERKGHRMAEPTDLLYQGVIEKLKPLFSSSFGSTLYLGKDSTAEDSSKTRVWWTNKDSLYLTFYFHSVNEGVFRQYASEDTGTAKGAFNKTFSHARLKNNISAGKTVKNRSGEVMDGKPRLSVASKLYKFTLLGNENLIVASVILFSLIILCFIFFLFIRFMLKMFFASTRFKYNDQQEKLEYVIKKHELYNLVFVNGLPFCGKFQKVEELFKDSDRRMAIIDFLIIPYPIKDGKKITNSTLDDIFKINDSFLMSNDEIIIKNFEYNFSDPGANKVKLNLIERLINLQLRVIIVSDIDPVSFIESYTYFDKASDSKQANQDKERWAKLLGGFYNLYYYTRHLIPNGRAILPILEKECSFGIFLPSIKDQLMESGIVNVKTPSDEILWRIQTMAHLYYRSIWDSLTRKEQYLIYDIAQDGLFNIKAMHTADALLAKGLLISSEGKIKLLNESFRNFILTEINKEEALAIARDIAEQGTWSSFRTPLLIIIGALVVFLGSTQQGSLNNLLSYVTMFLTGITLLQRVFTAFDGFGAKSS